MKIFTRTMAAVVLMAATGSAMANDIEGNVTLASDYVFRGVSQTDNGVAIQGGFDYSHDLEAVSLYAGAWGSNIDSDFFPQDPVMELDVYGGVSGEIEDFGYDVGLLRYFYPSGSINDTTEWHAGGSWKWLGATVYYSKDWFGTDDSAGRFEGTFDYDLPYEIGLSASVANNYGDGVEAFFSDSYVDWTIGVSKSWKGVDWAATYTDTDISSSDCGDPDLCDSTFVVSMSKSF